MAEKSQICLFTAQTPNGHKVSIVLEELDLPYDVRHMDMPAIEHKEPWFLEINPNGRIPALTDVLPDGTPIALFESGAIMQYLVDRYDTGYKISYPRGTKEYYQTNSWLLFQNAGTGPMQGQIVWFSFYGPQGAERQHFAIERYTKEVKRLYGVVDKHLSDKGSDYLIGDKATIGDIAINSWVRMMPLAHLDIGEFPTLEKWHQRMNERPAVVRGTDVPLKTGDLKQVQADPENFKAYLARNTRWAQVGTPLEKKDA